MNRVFAMKSRHIEFGRQRGAVLFIALIFLIIVTMLALTASTTSIMQIRMAGSLRKGQMSLMGSESALRGVESLIWSRSLDATKGLNCGGEGTGDNCYSMTNSSGTMGINSKVTTFRNLKGWPTSTTGDGAADYATTMTTLASTPSATLAAQPRYLIEDLGLLLPPGANMNIKGGIDRGPGRDSPHPHMYRTTARSPGPDATTARVVEGYMSGIPAPNKGSN